MASAKTKRHDGRVRIWCATCHDYVVIQGAATDNTTVRITPRHLEPHRASEPHTTALAATTAPRRRRGRRGGRGRRAR